MGLGKEQLERYARQIILPGVAAEGQEKLLAAKVLIVGAGGLGSPAALYLASAGIGTIGIVDSGKVELNNLHRQIIHSLRNLGRPKAESARERIGALNDEVKAIPYNLRVTAENILGMISDYDIVVDGADNFPTKYLLNDACVLAKKPLFHAGVFRFSSQAITILPGESACYRCLFPQPPPPSVVPACQEAGVLATAAAVMGVIQANEVLKFVLGIGELLTSRLLVFNALDSSFRKVKVPRDPHCPACGENPRIRKLTVALSPWRHPPAKGRAGKKAK